MGIFSFIANLFANIFSAIRREWNSLPSNVQAQIKGGSSAINILSQYIGQDPKLTIATLQANIPNVNLDQWYSMMSVLAKSWNLTIPATLEDLVVSLQTYLKSVEDSEWDRILSGGAQLLADILTGTSTPFGIIVSVIEFVYHEFVKDAPIVFAPIPETIVSEVPAQPEPSLGVPIDTTIVPQ